MNKKKIEELREYSDAAWDALRMYFSNFQTDAHLSLEDSCKATTASVTDVKLMLNRKYGFREPANRLEAVEYLSNLNRAEELKKNPLI